MVNILTIDLEDYFMVSAFEGVVKRENWAKYESRIERNTHRLLEILAEAKPCSSELHSSNPVPCTPHPAPGVKATFFCLGWVAEHHPHLIKEIHQRGHEIACHGYDHQLIYKMTPHQFREDIRKGKKILENIVGEGVWGYRAPSYSITERSLWAFEILVEEGFRYDSSVFPIWHDRYGIANAPRFPFVIPVNGNSDFESKIALNFELQTPKLGMCASAAVTRNSNQQFAIRNSQWILEFPISTVRLFGQNIPLSGGGYFRLLPYRMVKGGLRKICETERMPFVFYVHPWEIDPDQPRFRNCNRLSRFRHYVNLGKTESRFRKLLNDFHFSPIRDVAHLDCWMVTQTISKNNQPK